MPPKSPLRCACICCACAEEEVGRERPGGGARCKGPSAEAGRDAEFTFRDNSWSIILVSSVLSVLSVLLVF